MTNIIYLCWSIYIDQFILQMVFYFNFLKEIFSVVMHLWMVIITSFMMQNFFVRLLLLKTNFRDIKWNADLPWERKY